MRVGRRLTDREAYEVEFDHDGAVLKGLVPEALMDAARPGAPRHTPAYHWLAENRQKIEAAIIERAQGQTPRAPFDMIELSGRTTHAH
jgi:hypothetical protein